MGRFEKLVQCLVISALSAAIPAQVPTQGIKGPPQQIPPGIGPMDIPEAGHAAPGPAKPASTVQARSVLPANIMFDKDGGTLWAAGRNYKIAFDARGATFVPALGDAAPVNASVGFRLAGIDAGRKTHAAAEASPSRSGDQVRFNRGCAEERYDLAPEGVEQSFVLARPLGSGDHVVRIAVATELLAAPSDGGFAFSSPAGKVRYGQATVVDAKGDRLLLDAGLVDEEIRIVVPDSFLRNAAWPVVIDPLISTSTIFAPGAATDDCFNADGVNEFTSHFLVVAERAFSAADHDIYAWFCDYSGTVIPNSLTAIDLTTANWAKPKVAANTVVSQFLVVAQRGAAGARQIWGRTVSGYLPTSLSAQFMISGNEPGEKINPVVGGDLHTLAPTYYCVAWERAYSAADHDIHARRVDTAGVLGSLLYIENSTAMDERPSISRSNGAGLYADQTWFLVWQRDVGGEHDILGCQIDHDISNVTAPTGLITNGLDTTGPVVTTETCWSVGPHRYLVAYEVHGSPVTKIGFGIFEGSVFITGSNNLAPIEGVATVDRINPSVCCTGATFTITYAEQFYGNDYDIFATTLNMVGYSSFSTSEAHVPIFTSSDREDRPVIYADTDGVPVSVATYIVCESGAAPRSIIEARYDARAATGGMTTWPTGCQGLGIMLIGEPILGHNFVAALQGGSPFSIMVLSLPILPTQICSSCYLGVDLINNPIIIHTSSFGGTVPNDGSIVGLTVAIQGGDVGTAPCSIRVSDTLILTIQ